jgi:hypothetical protein
VDYILEIDNLTITKLKKTLEKRARKCIKINAAADLRALFLFGEDQTHFLISDYLSLGENQQVTANVVDCVVSEYLLKHLNLME